MTIVYTVKDGEGYTDSAPLFVTVNGLPVAQDDTETTFEDTAVTIDVLSKDTDVDGDEGGTDQSEVFVTATPVNDPPIARDDTAETDEETPADVDYYL